MDHHYTPEQAREKVARSGDENYGVVCEHGTLELGYYMPRGEDKQSPHDQDEVYVVLRGQGKIAIGDQAINLAKDIVVFVKAGTEHFFHDVTEDLTMLVFFASPNGV